jgi:hypothetical protein
MTSFGFGQRRKPDSEKHVLAPSLWSEPGWAAFFKRIGATPDDPENLRITSDGVARMIEDGRKAVNERVSRLEANVAARGLNDIRLRPFWLIQDNCWNGETGDFLIYHLRLNPYDEWNTVILAADARGASALDIPVHPARDIPAFSKAQTEAILALRDRVRNAHQEVQRTHEFGRFADLCDDTVVRVKQMAQKFAAVLVEGHKKFPPAQDETSARIGEK